VNAGEASLNIVITWQEVKYVESKNSIKVLVSRKPGSVSLCEIHRNSHPLGECLGNFHSFWD
jgi:hypothetical protein